MRGMKQATNLLIAGAMLGVVACDPAKQAAEARESQEKHEVETQKTATEVAERQENEREKLGQDQAAEQRKLNDRGAEVAAEARAGERKEANSDAVSLGKDQVAVSTDQLKERMDLQNKQAKDRLSLNKEHTERSIDDVNRVAKADAKLAAERADLQTSYRDKLTKLDERAADLRSLAASAAPNGRDTARSYLAQFETKRGKALSDLNRLVNTTASSLDVAKKTLDNDVNLMDADLDKAKSRL
jgi:hypothetical protein